jgi:hypothetical protein
MFRALVQVAVAMVVLPASCAQTTDVAPSGANTNNGPSSVKCGILQQCQFIADTIDRIPRIRRDIQGKDVYETNKRRTQQMSPRPRRTWCDRPYRRIISVT